MTIEDGVVCLYRKLSRALPDEFRLDYGEMIDGDAEDALRAEFRRRGALRLFLLLPRLLFDLGTRIVAEHLSEISQDTRYAVRILASSPWFTLAAVVCLSIGIGGSAGMYAQLRSTIFQPTPGVADPDSLVRIRQSFSYGMFENIRDGEEPFASVAAYHGPAPLLVSREGSAAERIWCHVVSPGYFDVLGVTPQRGRLFGLEEHTAGAAPAIVLSEGTWRNRFGADPSIIGAAIRVNGKTATVVGVAGGAFEGLSPSTSAADAWIPTTAEASLAPELQWLSDRGIRAFQIVGRLLPAFSIEQAEEMLEAKVQRLEQSYNDPGKDRKEQRVTLIPGGRLYPVRDQDLPRVIGFPFVLVSLVLLMACGNVSNMLLARGAERRAEIALRVSLGANRARIVRQLLTENILLAVLGWFGGILYAIGFLRMFESVKPMLPAYVRYESGFDWHSFLVAALVAAVCGLLFGLAPALRAGGQNVYAGLKRNALGAIRRYRLFGLRNVLVFQQVAFSMVLLLLTGFIVIGWQRAAAVDTGYEPGNLFIVHMDPVRDGYSPAESASFFERLPDDLRRVPGVMNAGIAQSLPPALTGGDGIIAAKTSFTDGVASDRAIRSFRVGEGFFSTAGIRLEAGRDFRRDDQKDDARVLIVNRTLADGMGGPRDAVGKTLELDEQTWEVIGVAADTRPALPLAAEQPEAYLPNAPSGYGSPAMRGVAIAVRSALGADGPIILRREIERIDPRLTVVEIRRMTDEIQQMYFLARFSAYIYGGMGLFGLVLAAVGLAGVTAYSVARRTHEIGIRMAMGAQRWQILWLVMKESGSIVLAGTVAGVVAALLVMRALSATLQALAETTRMSLSDPLVVVGGPALLAGIALLACYFPARRSTRVNPVAALRAE